MFIYFLPFQMLGRAPNSQPDRYVEQEGDEDGVIKGTYTYLDPNWTWQTVSP